MNAREKGAEERSSNYVELSRRKRGQIDRIRYRSLRTYGLNTPKQVDWLM